ncbi:MAG: chorismate-binding protein, partial [Candidatus Zixiibacteriota bacterium]
TILSSSPERLVSVCGDSIIANPIKGTIERGPTDREALHNQSLLLASAKDRAELLMIVDLLRNDLGKICRYGTVKTHSIWKPEVYSSLIHLVGDIRGQLRPHTTVSEIIRATLPGGSITGAPKRRAVEILSEIEGRPRGIYTGSFGYAYRDRLDLNIAIRTITHTLTESGPTFVVQAGGGIVADSDSAAEFDEARLKARNLLKAIDPALEP